jgi:hypothetical protein
VQIGLKTYNLVSDPFESTNLYLKENAKVKELSELMEKIIKQGFSRE